MATTQSSDLTHDILFVNFNRSYSSLFIGMTSGCKIIDLTKIPVIEEVCNMGSEALASVTVLQIRQIPANCSNTCLFKLFV